MYISKAGQNNKLKIKGGNKSGGNRKENPRKSLKWYGNVMRREERYTGRRAMEMKVQGRRKRGRPKRKWLDSVRGDIKEKGLLVCDRATWRHIVHRPHIKFNKIGIRQRGRLKRHSSNTIEQLFTFRSSMRQCCLH